MIATAGVVAGCLVASTFAALPAMAQAAETTLYASASGTGTSCSSTSPCSLSTALGDVGPGGVVDLVTLGASAHYDGNFTVSTAGTSASAPVTIQPAPGVTDPTLDGTDSGTVLAINTGVYVNLSGITITGGNADFAGGIFTLGTVTVTDSTISNNSAQAAGGGIYIGGGKVTVTDSTISGNGATTGGGIYIGGGKVTVTDSTISNNTATAGTGGGITNLGVVTVTDSTISNNSDIGATGGGITNLGVVTVTDSTISGNGATTGGGIYNLETVTVTDSTISGNTATGYINSIGGGIFNAGGSVSLEADLLATSGGPPAGGECAGSITDLGFNVSDDSSCEFTSATSMNDSAAAEDLGPLQNNGGLTQTIEPTAGNPAIGLIPNPTSGLCPTTDQRGFTSVAGAACDAGSVQVAAQTITLTSSAPASANVGDVYTPAATGGASGNPVVFSIPTGSATVCTISSGVVHFIGPGSCVIDANQAGNTYYVAAATVAQTVTVIDADLAITTTRNITTPATGPNGATVNYTLPVATDEGSTPTVTCNPPSGSTFPVGTTTVTCKASSSDDTNSPVITTFTVTVQGAAAQLSDLATAVQGVGPGKSLAEKVSVAQSALAEDNVSATCSILGAFSSEVEAQVGKKIGSSQANQLFVDAQRIRAVLSC